MMKKMSYALLGAGLLTSTLVKAEEASFAAAPVAAPCNFSGAYVGLTFGQSITKYGNFLQDGQIGGGAPANYEASSKQNPLASGFTGGIFAGWGKEFASRLYAGLELSYLMDTAKVKALDIAAAETVQLKKKDTFEAALRLGMAMNNALPYIKVGFANSKFENSFENTVGKLKESKRLNGFVVGAGIDMKVAPKMMVGLGYTYTAFKKWKGKKVSPSAAAMDPTTNHMKHEMKPTSHNIMLRVAYTF